MSNLSYGFDEISESKSNIEDNIEEINQQGYTVIHSVFNTAEISVIRDKIYSIYQKQVSHTGQEFLQQIGDDNICRCPMAYDHDFAKYASNETFMTIAECFLGDYFILSVQNANISKPNLKHAQSSWHRDLPYQNFTSSRPLAINFLVAIDDFTVDNGGVVVLPHSQKMETIPSKGYLARHERVVTAKAGDAIAFDSMLIHRAGVNHSQSNRCSFNHMYTRPFIKQQYDYANIMSKLTVQSKRLHQISGISSRTAADDVDWRKIRKEKMKL